METRKPYNTLLYLGFVSFGIYHLFFHKDFSESTIYIGIALLFDPFDQQQPWKEKPMWQRIILFTQASLVISIVIYTIISKLLQ